MPSYHQSPYTYSFMHSFSTPTFPFIYTLVHWCMHGIHPFFSAPPYTHSSIHSVSHPSSIHSSMYAWVYIHSPHLRTLIHAPYLHTLIHSFVHSFSTPTYLFIHTLIHPPPSRPLSARRWSLWHPPRSSPPPPSARALPTQQCTHPPLRCIKWCTWLSIIMHVKVIGDRYGCQCYQSSYAGM